MGVELDQGDNFFDQAPPIPASPATEVKRQDKLADIAKQITEILADLDRRVKVLEDRYTNLRKKTQFSEQNLLETEKNMSKELRGMQEATMNLKTNLDDVGEKLSLFSSEFDNVAKKTDLTILQKYMDLWQPMNFVTRADLKAILEEMHKKKK
jgi:hypothetical protein